MKKKIFTLLGLALMGTASVRAQLALEGFNSAGLPSGWTVFNDANTVSPTISPSYIIPLLQANGWTKFAVASGDSAMLSVSFFNPTATADRWLITPSFNVTSANMVLSWYDADLSSSGTSPIEVLVSTTGGTTQAAFTTTLTTSQTSGANGLVKKGVYLGGYNGQSVRIAFRNHAQAKGFPAIDKVQTEVITTPLDAGITAINFPTLMTSSSTVKVTVANNGAQKISSVNLSYKIDGGTAVTQNFTGLDIQPFGSQELSFTTQVSGLSTGGHTVQADITQTNGAADPVTSNNTKTRAFTVPGAAVTRAGLIEEFTSSTCNPCAAFNVTFDPLILSNNANVPSSNFNIVKYQMNWPSPGTDASYNNDGYRRRVYYNVSGIPDHYTNGAPGGNGNQAEIDASKTKSAYLNIEGSYFVKSDSIFATIKLNPNFTIANANFKLYAAATEDHYTNNAATTSQKEYYHVMRKMLPSGDGTTVANWTSGQQQTYTFAAKYVNGNVTQMSNNFWISPRSGNLVVFVQDVETGEILQSKSIPAQWATGVGQVTTVNDIKLFPNPAATTARLSFTNTEKGQVSVSVIDAAGRTVATVADGVMSVGAQTVDINTSTMAAGVYNVVIRTERGQTAERLSVVK